MSTKRTNAGLVKGVLMNDYDSSACPSLDPFIRTANVLTNQVLARAVEKGITISNEVLIEVETWLAAHFYATSERPVQETQNLRARDVYQGRTGKGMDATYYGQTAQLLDTSGILTQMVTPNKKVGITWLGTTDTDALDYEDRN